MYEHLPNLWGSGDAMESSDGFVRSGFEKVDSTPANQEAGMDFMIMDWTTERSSAGFRVESDRHRIIPRSVLVLLRLFLLYLVFTVPKPGSTNVDSCEAHLHTVSLDTMQPRSVAEVVINAVEFFRLGDWPPSNPCPPGDEIWPQKSKIEGRPWRRKVLAAMPSNFSRCPQMKLCS